MAGDTLITEDLKKLIGVLREPIIFKVEAGAIQRYAQAIDDQNPQYNDVEYASKSKYGKLICPPGFTGWPIIEKIIPIFQLTNILLETGAPPRALDGGIEYEFFGPIYAGDIIIASGKVISITERETKSGKIMFAIDEMTYYNQNGAVVLVGRQTLIFR